MDLSVIIVTYNSGQFIRKCLTSLLNSKPRLNWEIIVVDNASKDKTADLVKSEFPGIKVISNAGNFGYSMACNRGIKEASGKYIFILNPDTEFLNGSWDELIGFMESRPYCGILGPKLLDGQGRIEFSCRGFISYSSAFFSRRSLLTRVFSNSRYAQRYLKTGWQHDTVEEVDWVSGAAMIIKRKCLDDIGSFDEGFFMYCEDVDICKRAQDKGWKVLYYPTLEFLHIIGGSIKYTSPLATIWHHRSIWRYYRKHLKVNIIWDALVFLAIFLRALSLGCFNLIASIPRFIFLNRDHLR